MSPLVCNISCAAKADCNFLEIVRAEFNDLVNLAEGSAVWSSVGLGCNFICLTISNDKLISDKIPDVHMVSATPQNHVLHHNIVNFSLALFRY